MRLSSVVLVVAGLLAAGGCAGNKCRGLDRPADLGDEWVWGAEALPTGDVSTSNLTIEKFMPARVLPDSVYAYTVRVTNVSKGSLTDVDITDTLPAAGYTLISTEPEATRSGAMLRWPVGAMGPGQAYTIRVTGHLEAGYRASTCATVAYVAPPSGPSPEQVAAEKAAADKKAAEKTAADKAAADKAAAEKKAAADKAAADKAAADKAAADKATAEKAAAAAAAAAATKAAADKAAADKTAADKAAADKAAAEKAAAAAPAKLELTMTMPPEANAFDGVVFKMLLRNTGKTKATEVRVVDQFPDGMTVNGKKYVAFAVGELAPGAGREFTVRMNASKTGKFKNTATVTGAGGLKAEASGETNVWKAVLTVTNKPGADSFGLGKDATFSFTVTNTSDKPAADCSLRVTMTGADSVKGADNGGTVTGTTATWKLGELAKGASKTVTVKAVRAKAGTVDCSATASSKSADPVTAASKGAYK